MALEIQQTVESASGVAQDYGGKVRSATKNRIGRDDAYLAWLHTLPCAVCEMLRLGLIEAGIKNPIVQLSRTEAAHVGNRGAGQLCPDREAIPLCGIAHHREGPTSHHKLQKQFWKYWNLDRNELIAALNAKYESEHLGVLNPLEVIGAL